MISTRPSPSLRSILGGGLLAIMAATSSVADTEFVPFSAFLEATEKAEFEQYAQLKYSHVANKENFLAMKSHIADTYYKVEVNHSFVFPDTGYVDCINLRTQPSLRRGDKFSAPAIPPKLQSFKEDESKNMAEPVPTMLNGDKVDDFGNLMACSQGFIPMARIELEDLVRYSSLADFFNKFGSQGATGAPEATKSGDPQ